VKIIETIDIEQRRREAPVKLVSYAAFSPSAVFCVPIPRVCQLVRVYTIAANPGGKARQQATANGTLDRDAFLAKCGFGQSRGYTLVRRFWVSRRGRAGSLLIRTNPSLTI
jgi:hypothetical protein